MSDSSFDLVVIGSGPGGYVCAIRAAQLGLKTAIIEKDSNLGGTCLNVGCIPSKALLHSSHLFHQAAHGEVHGIKAKGIELDLTAMMKRKDGVVEQLRGGVGMLLKQRGVSIFKGHGSFVGPGKIEIKGDKSTETIEAKNTVIATGSVPVELPFLKFDGDKVVSSDHGIAFDEVPKRLVVIGGGAIGLELGSVWARLGSEVSIVEFLPSIAGGLDADISKLVERIFKKQGLKIHTQTKVTEASVTAKGVTLKAEKKGKPIEYEADKVLVSVGRKAFTGTVGLDKVGVKTDERGRIVVDEKLRTGVDGIWAIGDVIAGPMLAHKAEEDGVAVAEWIAGKAGHTDWDAVPGVIYTEPEIATVGLSEAAAKEAGIPVKIGKFPLQANGRAIAQAATDGIAKLVAHAETDRLLGATIVAAGASEMVASISAHMVYGGSAEDLARTVHAHPTISESIKESAMAVDGWSIHSL
jgi:dihydrolipoamide dehydrogenase|tara:strand:- start:45371 stop:46771 length:1401 start_codon:yes stop_codon:yes gene_type:complete